VYEVITRVARHFYRNRYKKVLISFLHKDVKVDELNFDLAKYN
jgi:hypothetical protein